MSHHEDLLDHALDLVTMSRGPANPANFRRAISAAYYAVFHLFIDEACQFAASGEGFADLQRMAFLTQLRRAFDHATIRKLMARVGSGGLTREDKVLICSGGKLDQQLKNIGTWYLELHDGRTDADYDLGSAIGETEAITLVEAAVKVFETWAQVRGSAQAKGLLAALIVALNPRSDRTRKADPSGGPGA
jgi:hypothetical protein